MGETAASSASASAPAEMDRKRKYMEGFNSITQTQQVVVEEGKMILGGGGEEEEEQVTTAAADSRRKQELLEEEDPLQLTLSPYVLRRQRTPSLLQVQQHQQHSLPFPSPSPRQQLLLPTSPPPPPGFVFPHQDHHHHGPLSSFSSTPVVGYPEVVHHHHHHLLATHHDPLAQLHAGMGPLLPNSVPLPVATAANAAAPSDQSRGRGGGGGAGVLGSSASTTATNTARAAAAAAAAPPSSSSSSSNRNRNSSSNRRNSTQGQAPRVGKDDTVPPPFDWATDRRAIVQSLAYLRSKGIGSISGEVQCKRCDSQYTMEYDVESKFMEMEQYIRMYKSTMHDRAPKEWMTPKLPNCQKCGQHDCIKPIISSKKRSINWLFLLLGKMLGCCTLEQLRYFCKHTKNHRTGAKDRVLYLTYLGLCKQLHPDGPFDR